MGLEEISQDCGARVLLGDADASGSRQFLVIGPPESLDRARMHIRAWLAVNSGAGEGFPPIPDATLSDGFPPGMDGFPPGMDGFPPGMDGLAMHGFPPGMDGAEMMPSGFPPGMDCNGGEPPPCGFPPAFPPGLPPIVHDAYDSGGMASAMGVAPESAGFVGLPVLNDDPEI